MNGRKWWLFILHLSLETHTHTHTRQHNLVERWPSVQTDRVTWGPTRGLGARRAQTVRVMRRQRRRETVSQTVEETLLPGYRLESSNWTHWTSSHMPCGSHTPTHFTTFTLHLPTLHPSIKKHVCKQTSTKWRRKACWAQTEASEASWQFELSSANHHTPADTGSTQGDE